MAAKPWPVAPGPGPHGAVVIELIKPLIKALLLRRRAVGRRIGGVFLKSSVHPLVAAILFRVTRVGVFHADAQPEPADRQPGKAAGIRAAEGRAVINPDALGQADLAKQLLKHLGY